MGIFEHDRNHDDNMIENQKNIHKEVQDIKNIRTQNKSNESLFSIDKKAKGLLEPGNLDLNARKVLRKPDKSYMTEKSITIEADGKQIIIPTIVKGKELTNKEAIEHYRKTGEHLGKFKDEGSAEDYAYKLHLRQEKYYNRR